MKIGIQYQRELQPEQVQKAGFSYLELPYEECGEKITGEVSGIFLKGESLSGDILQDALEKAAECRALYLVINTEGEQTTDRLCGAICECAEAIRNAAVDIYIENGYYCDAVGNYYCTPFSEAGKLLQMAADFDEICGRNCFGICLNIGYGNLLGKNLRAMIEELGEKLRLVHASDNDGVSNQHQLPYTFTTGRGAMSTDWYRVIGSLVRIGFQGWIVFDVNGLFKRLPERLQGAMLKLLWSIPAEWEEQFTLEQRLDQPEKKLILFGAGVMAKNYMDAWGEKYPPAFFVDNNSSIWGEQRLGIEVRSPEAILEIPEEDRNVWICNQYYDAIGEQLSRMGISYQCYWDHYYL